MKKTTILLISLSAVSASYAQLRILPGGRIGVGTNTPIEKVHVVGGGLHLSQNGNEFRFLPDNGGTEIGSNTGKIEFWYSSPVNYNDLRAKSFVKMSDRALKDNIEPIKNGLQAVLQLQGVSYTMKEGLETQIREYGFIAQDVDAVIKNIAEKTTKGYLGLDYDEIIPFLVEAVKEQQTIIDEMRAAGFGNEKSAPYGNGSEAPEAQNDVPRLFQNNPNPYKENTQIAYYLPDNTVSAALMLFDLQGTLVATYPLQGKGSGSFLLNAGSHKAGMYHYTLVVNGEAVDTKKMILTQ